MTMRRLINWYCDNADAVVGVLAGVSVVMIALFFAGCCVIGMIKLWAMMW